MSGHAQRRGKQSTGRRLDDGVCSLKQTQGPAYSTSNRKSHVAATVRPCFPDKQVPSAQRRPAPGKRDGPDERLNNHKDTRLPPPPIRNLSSSVAFPRSSFYSVSRGNSMFLTDTGNKTQQPVLRNTLIRAAAVLCAAGTFCLSHLLSLSRGSPVVSCEARFLWVMFTAAAGVGVGAAE